jgi:hypothetical protein
MPPKASMHHSEVSMRFSYVALGAVASMAAAASFASIPPVYQAHLPPEHSLDGVPFISGGVTREEEDAVKRAAQEWPLEIVFDEQDGKADRTLDDMPVTITDASGRVVFDGISRGPVMLVKLPKGSYTVTTKWDAWTFERRATIGDDRERVVFDWKRASPPST